MQLSYRGAHYETHDPHVEAVNTGTIGTYRGAPLKGKSYKVDQGHHGRVQLVYRGVKYSHEV